MIYYNDVFVGTAQHKTKYCYTSACGPSMGLTLNQFSLLAKNGTASTMSAYEISGHKISGQR